MSVRLADSARSRIVLIGTPTHRHVGLPDVPEVANNIADLAAVFIDPELGGIDADHCVTTSAAVGLDELGEVLHGSAALAEDLLLIYYAGHGLLDRRGRLHLALAGTHPDRLGFTALPYETLRAVCLDSDAASKVVILDSCFSGRAIGKTLADEEQQVLGQLEVAGTYTLTSASGSRAARILPGEEHTAFTGRLLRLLRDGDPQAGSVLSIGEIYRRLRSRLRAEGLPEPHQRGTATADLLGLVRNRRSAPSALAVLPDEIRDGLDSRYPNIRLGAVHELGEWLTIADPARVQAARLALQQVADHDDPAVAGAARSHLAAVDPALAPLVAPVTTDRAQAGATPKVADLAESRLVTTEVEQIVGTVKDGFRPTSLAGVEQTWATTDPVWVNSVLPEPSAEDPWQTFARTHAIGQVVPGKVTKLVSFGSFVRVDEGIEGLVHISELAERHVEVPEQVVNVNDEIFVKVIDIDLDRRRISLSLKQANEGLTGDAEVDQFDPALYGMAATYDDQGNYIYPEGFDPETGEWLEGFDAQREVWEAEYAAAHAKFEAHQKQIAEARKADAEAGIQENAEGAPSSYSSGAVDADAESSGGALASDEALAALREKLSGGQS